MRRERASELAPRARGVAWLVVTAALAACELALPAGHEPHRETNRLDMGDQPRLKPQRGDLLGQLPNGMLPPPAGALDVDEQAYPWTPEQAEQAAAAVANPLSPTPRVLAHGKFIYDNVCIACHGPQAAGDGEVTRLFPKPPSLLTQKIRDWSDSRIFHVPMRGQNSMPSQAKLLKQTDIWAAILHLRTLQQTLPVAPPPPAPAAAAGPATAPAVPTTLPTTGGAP